MSKLNESAFPMTDFMRDGLSKREYFAGLAMQSLVSLYHQLGRPELLHVPSDAVAYADALIAELGKNTKSTNSPGACL